MNRNIFISFFATLTLAACGTATNSPNTFSAVKANKDSTLWDCKAQKGKVSFVATVKKEANGTVSGIFAKNVPDVNGSNRGQAWPLQNLKVTSCGGFTPCDSFKGSTGSASVDLFVNYNNETSTSGGGHLTFSDLSIKKIDVDVICTRVLK